MNIVLTGDCGLIGSSLVGVLLKNGHHVHGIDKKPESELEPIKQYHDDFDCVRGERISIMDLISIIEDITMKKILNYRCKYSIKDGIMKYIELLKTG